MRTLHGVGAALVLLFAACGAEHDPAHIRAAGHVEATEVRVSTKVGGQLEAFALREGDKVDKGQELARMDTTDIRLALQQAQAVRDQAAAQHRLALAGAREEDKAQAEAQVRAAEVELAAGQRDLERMQGLLDRGSGPVKARDDAATRRDGARARLEALQEALERLRKGTRPEEKDAARAQLAAAEARVAQLEQQMKDATITSPVAGIVTEKLADEGELLQPGSPLCVVTELARAWLTVYVAEPDLGRIRLGDEATVHTDDGQERRGRINFIASQAEFTPKNVQTRDERVKLVFKVKVGLDNADGLFKPGMPAEASLTVAARVGEAR